jgi:acyl transferase domain-containing protein/phospholipid N-methyltransferase
MTEKSLLSPEGSCKTFSADADGFARGEGITAVYIKPLAAAIRDGNPIRAVIRSTASNSDGKTTGILQPSTDSQEAMIRKAYQVAGITDYSKTAFVECHGTGTAIGDPIEANAVARVFGDSGVFIGSVKPNLGHSEGASGLTSLIKAVLTLENRIIPPNIKFSSPNPKIPFQERKLTVPLEPTPWPESYYERVSVNSFGIGGSNAHAILDSAHFSGVSTLQSASQTNGSPQLLLFSASSAASLQRMTIDFQDWVSNNPDNLENLAYTLANRRELLPYRAFMVASRDRPGVASQGKGAANPSPNLVMVFTGQGAQWPRMGRELLLRSDLCFQSSIRSLDNYLQDAADAPTWTLEEELMKPARTSSVQKAELSQPLCTAVQIALVDLFAAVGVKPSVVVGHSSGEIAAAYAAGALTAREAIIAAWQRGRAANKQTRPGAMAAVGLSWDEVRAFLTPNVVVACENSPRSITLSGDSSEVEGTILRIRKSYPDATVKLLKVDKAYHSHHMVEIGDEYRSELQHSLDGTLPLRPFFSSITGKKEAGILDAAYWQKNLESPVLFRAAVSGILDQFKDVAFLEIGPHSALAGPVRQILAAASSSAPYIPAMARNEDCVESFLSAVGKLFELNISLDFNALVPRGSSLPDLPRYPWNHQDEYWPESRISHEWRHREFPSHPLLGLRQLESTSIEPSWRNLLYVDGVSWLRDHRVEDDIIFPCAGYISMVGEGIRQITSRQSSFTVRQLVLTSALVLSEGKPAELVTTFRPHRLTDTIDSKWWEFTIASHNGHIWAKHCSGKVTCEAGLAGEPVQAQDTALLPRKLGRRNYYDMCNRVGFRYGPNFQRLEGIRTGTVQQLATAQIAGYRTGDEQDYHIHPTILDGCIQLAPLAATYGRLENNHDRRVPTKVDRVTIHRCTSGIDMRVSATATITKGNGDVIGQVQCTANGKVVLDVEGVKLSPLEVTEATETDTLHTTARITWGPHIDFLDPGSLIKPAIPRHLYTPSLDELARLCLVYSHRRLKGASTTLPHMQMYQSWIQRQVHDFGDDSPIAALDDAVIMDKINGLVLGMSDTPVADIAFATQKFVNNIQGVFTGEKDALEMLLSDDLLRKVYISTDACDRSQFIRHVAHSKPNLRILEIGAGTGATTASVLKHLVLPIGQPLYSKYTFTDISSAFSVSAKERFKHYRNIEYRVLDISSDPAEQGFQDEKYDLIIATNVIHATKSLCDSLKHVHKLLDHKGRLLLQELYSISKWPNFIFGTLPGWWFGGPDGRPDEPYVAPIRWDSELKKAGFEGLDTVILDGEEPYQWNAIMVAKPQAQSMKVMKKSVTLLYESGEGYAELLSQQLRSKGYTVHPCQLGEELPGSQDVISLLDCSRPFFEDIDEARYKAFQRLLDNLGGSAMLWVTHLCQVKCEDPRYAQMIGTARAIRAEMLLDFATCEVDDISSSLKNIVDVFSKFQEREEDESLEPDYEYVIVDGIVNVGRVYPFSLKDELLAETSLDDQVVLDMIKPGRLGSLRWIPRGARPLKGNEVEIQIYAAGLNFKVGCLANV